MKCPRMGSAMRRCTYACHRPLSNRCFFSTHCSLCCWPDMVRKSRSTFKLQLAEIFKNVTLQLNLCPCPQKPQPIFLDQCLIAIKENEWPTQNGFLHSRSSDHSRISGRLTSLLKKFRSTHGLCGVNIEGDTNRWPCHSRLSYIVDIAEQSVQNWSNIYAQFPTPKWIEVYLMSQSGHICQVPDIRDDRTSTWMHNKSIMMIASDMTRAYQVSQNWRVWSPWSCSKGFTLPTEHRAQNKPSSFLTLPAIGIRE